MVGGMPWVKCDGDIPDKYQSVLCAVFALLLHGFDNGVGVAQRETLPGIRVISVGAWRRRGEKEIFVDLSSSQLKPSRFLDTARYL